MLLDLWNQLIQLLTGEEPEPTVGPEDWLD